MHGKTGDFMTALTRRTSAMSEACTRCGRCFEACPTAGPAGLEQADGKAVITGVIDILAGGAGTPEAERWAGRCAGSGQCITACPEGLNPRFMLAMARKAMQRRSETPPSQHRQGVANFRNMSRGVRVLSRLQLPHELLQRLGRKIGPADEPETPDVVFYTGCNILKTPHIALLCLDLMDALGVSYRVLGGPSHCCGVLQFRAGDMDTSGNIAYSTIDHFGATGSGEVLSWCPTCQIQLGEIAMPSYAETRGPAPFDLTPFVVFLERNLNRLRPLMVQRVEKRVALHEHAGLGEITSAARRILQAVPGLEFVDLDQARAGYMCTSLSALPDFKQVAQAAMLDAAAAAGVTTLAGIYHACHRELCGHESAWPFEVRNFLELVGESMGLHRPDLFKRLKLMQDVDAIIRDAGGMIAQHGMSLDEVRQVIAKDMLGEGFDLRPDARA